MFDNGEWVPFVIGFIFIVVIIGRACGDGFTSTDTSNDDDEMMRDDWSCGPTCSCLNCQNNFDGISIFNDNDSDDD